MKTCTWTLQERGPYSDYWNTTCGHRMKLTGPIEVGPSFTPDPIKFGYKFCPNCGGKVIEKGGRRG